MDRIDRIDPDRFREQRQRLGLSQAALGALCGLTQNPITAIEKGRTRKPRYLLELAYHLRTTPEWLMGQDPSPAPPPPAHLTTVFDQQALMEAFLSARPVWDALGEDLTAEQQARHLVRLYLDRVAARSAPPTPDQTDPDQR